MRIYTINGRNALPSNPIARALLFIVGLIVVGTLAFFGFFFLIGAALLGVVWLLYLRIRMLFAKPQPQPVPDPRTRPSSQSQTRVIEGDYKVVDKE